MKLFLIRHGQTDWNLQGKLQGSYDSELNETGINQAKELSRNILINNFKFSKIYSSMQKRALKTAQILSEAANVGYVPIKGLEEIRLGEWEGLSWKEVKEKYPAEYKEWNNNPGTTKTPKGESYQDVLERALSVIHKITLIYPLNLLEFGLLIQRQQYRTFVIYHCRLE
jgi:probable phosphoglycerate mutase